MRTFHNITITVFCKHKEDDPQLIETKLRQLIPFDIEKEKVTLQKQKATGLENNIITIFEIITEKESLITLFLKWFLNELDDHQKRMLHEQLHSRLDEELSFFIRLDKEAWNRENKLVVVDHGNCYHIKMRVAAYPKSREAAISVLRQFF